jgi:outer membrane protein TolC
VPRPAAPAPPPPADPNRPYATTQPTTYPIDLPTAVRLADAENPTANVARARAREALANLDKARVAWVPNLVLGPTFFYHAGIDQNRRGEIFSVSRGNFSLLAGPQLRVDLGDVLYLPLVARRVAQAARSRSQVVTNDVQLDTALAYLDLLELQALLAINADILAKPEQVHPAAEAGTKAGISKTAADVNRTVTELELRRLERVVLRGRTAAARLASLLMIDPSVELTPVEVAVVPVTLIPGEMTLQQLITTAVRARPEVSAAVAESQAADTLVRQARAAPLMPKVGAEFLGGGFSGGIDDRFVPMRGQLNATTYLAWQVDNFGLGNAATVRAREASQTAALFRVREARVAAEVAQAAELAAARFQTLGSAQEAVRQAQEMYRKYRDIQFGLIGARPVVDALELLTAVPALNQARVQ